MNLSNKKVLFVDDNDSIRQTGSLILESWNMNVVEVTNGTDAIEKATTEHPDVMLLDVGLPSMDGFEVCKILKDNPDTKDIAIILLTGRGASGDIDKGYEYGADSYLIKPVDWEELKTKIGEIIE